MSGAPGNTRYRLGTYSKDRFNTVPKLVAYYIGTAGSAPNPHAWLACHVVNSNLPRSPAHPYIGRHFLMGEVIPENQNGGAFPLTSSRSAHSLPVPWL